MRRAPAKPVRACILRKWCPISHVTFKAPLRTSHFSLRSSHSTLHTAPFALNTSLHTALLRVHASHFTLHSPHFALPTAFFTSHSTLHTALFTPHALHCTLHTPHFISSEPFSPYPNSSLLISFLPICHLSFHESLPSTTTKELACTVRQPGPCVRHLCEAVAVLLSKKMTCARPRRNATPSKHFPHTSHCTLHTPHSALHNCTSSQLISSELFSSHVMSSHMSAKFFLAIFMSTTSQYWCLLQKLPQSTSQYYFVLQSLHKIFPSTTLYYKACTKHFPVLLCTTKLAQSTS